MNTQGLSLDHPVLLKIGNLTLRREAVMKTVATGMGGFQKILERKEDELVRALRRRESIAIEKSPEQMDEIQYASERDLAIQNVDREFQMLQQVTAALRRIHAGSFGTCIECESAIGPGRLAAVPWAQCCIRCQAAADREGQGAADLSAPLTSAA
jgi:DnaK suppressor protein